MRAPAEVFCLAEHLYDEMKERGWRTEDVAARMGTPSGVAMDTFRMDLIMAVQDDKMIIEDEIFDGLGRAFDVSPAFFRHLHEQWKAHPDKRSPFECPDEVLSQTAWVGRHQ